MSKLTYLNWRATYEVIESCSLLILIKMYIQTLRKKTAARSLPAKQRTHKMKLEKLGLILTQRKTQKNTTNFNILYNILGFPETRETLKKV